jgi:hypothetical protein
MSQARFSMGQLVITARAKDVLHPQDVQGCVERHAAGDWGELCDGDRRENEIALVQGLRLFSVYHDRSKIKFYIITEHDRSVTTILLPEDY